MALDGDLAYVARYKDTALRALEWARRFGDRDGDGFLEYVKRSPRGLKNQAWKDSDEAIRYPDGSMVENPIATVEEQAYYCVALQRMRELLFALGDEGPAEGFLQTARRLKRRWHEAFGWRRTATRWPSIPTSGRFGPSLPIPATRWRRGSSRASAPARWPTA